MRFFNWRPDVPDFRDRIYSPGRVRLDRLKRSVDLRPVCSAVEDQGELGSCTGNAIAGAIELLDVRNGGAFTDISRLFIYYQERVYENSINEDSGAYIRDGIKAVARVGAASEALWPYDINRFDVKPSAAAYADAKTRKFKSYQRIVNLNDMLHCLSEGFPFVFGFAVYESFMSQTVERTGTVPMPKSTERMLGGHAVLAVGYNRSTQRFIVRNSWGASWGRDGYFTMPFKYLASRDLSDDFWTIRG